MLFLHDQSFERKEMKSLQDNDEEFDHENDEEDEDSEEEE